MPAFDAWGDAWGDSWGVAWLHTPREIHRPEGPSRGKRQPYQRRPYWWEQAEYLEQETKVPTPEEADEALRAAAEKMERFKARVEAMRDEAERKEMSKARDDKRRSYSDRLENAFGLARKDGHRWPKQ